jgi:hypothetical protein
MFRFIRHIVEHPFYKSLKIFMNILYFLFMVQYVLLSHFYVLCVKLSIEVNRCVCTMLLVLQVAVFNHSKHSGMNLNKIVT